MQTYPYNFIINSCKNRTAIIPDENCNGFTVINKGLVDCEINGINLKPASPGASGESISFGGNLGEIYRGRIDVSFPNGIVNADVLVIQKVYLQKH